ncbi:MAG TPA: protein kinase [Acidimicrobiales bacterium]
MVAATIVPQLAGYRDLSPLGRGGHSDVYRARQERFDRWVALKVLRLLATDAKVRRRFLRECRLAGRVSAHPHVVSVLDAGVTVDGHPYLALELYEGGSLADRLTTGRPLDLRTALRSAVALAGALESAHRAGVVHRDVKPGNVLLTPYGDPALADFGLSVVAAQQELSTGLDAFSPYHAPPEVVEGALPSAVSDVYSLASTAYTMVAGRPPHRLAPGEAPAALLGRIARGQIPPLGRDDAPRSLDAALRAALDRDPAERTPTALAFAEALREVERALGHEPTEPVVLTPPEPATPPITAGPAERPAHAAEADATDPRGRPAVAGAPPAAAGGAGPATAGPGPEAGGPGPGAGRRAGGPAGHPAGPAGAPAAGPGGAGRPELRAGAPPAGDPDETVLRSRLAGPWPPSPADDAPGRRTRRRVALVAAGLLVLAGTGGAAALAVTGDAASSVAGPGATSTAAPSTTTAPTTVPTTAPPTTEPPTTAPPTTAPPTDLAVADVSATAAAPDSTDGCGSRTTYGPANVVDGARDTGWSVEGDATGETLTLTLDGERRVRSVGLLPGYAKVDACTGVDRFPENRRPTAVTWRFDDGTAVTQTLADTPELQAIEVDATTSTVEMTIDGVTGDPRRDFTVVSEVTVRGE